MGTTTGKTSGNEVVRFNPPASLQNQVKHTESTPQLLTKKWLCAHFGFIRPGGQAYYQGLYKHVLTPAVLAAAGLDLATVRHRKLKTFDRTATLRLIEILEL